MKIKVDKFIEEKKKKKQYIKPYDIAGEMYIFYVQPTTKLLNEVSEHYLTVKNYKKSVNKDYIPIEIQNTQERKRVYTILMAVFKKY